MGVLPVAWACRPTVVGGIILPGVECAQLKIDDCDGDPYDLDCTYILMDSVKVKENNKGGKCDPDITDPTNPDYCYAQKDLVCSGHLDAPTCEAVEAGKTDCDLNNDCIDELMTGGARSWLDLDGGGGGANELTDWIKNGSQTQFRLINGSLKKVVWQPVFSIPPQPQWLVKMWSCLFLIIFVMEIQIYLWIQNSE